MYETPPQATRALLLHEALPKVIWEPAAGRGALARVLRHHGHKVIAEDVQAYPGAPRWVRAGRDFFAASEAPSGATCIVTNPPFKDADRFVRHGLTLVPTVIVLLRLMALEGVRRSDLVDRHLWRVWAFRERLPMLHRDGWDGRRVNGSGMPFAWMVFRARPRPAGSPIELRRISARGEP